MAGEFESAVDRMVENKSMIIIELEPNGDPNGRGYVGRQSDDGGKTWSHRGM